MGPSLLCCSHCGPLLLLPSGRPVSSVCTRRWKVPKSWLFQRCPCEAPSQSLAGGHLRATISRQPAVSTVHGAAGAWCLGQAGWAEQGNLVGHALTGTKGHPSGEVVIVFIPGLFQQELPRRSLVTASPWVSLVCRLGSEGAGQQFSSVEELIPGFCPGKRETLPISICESVEIVSAEPQVTGDSFLGLSTPCRKQQAPRSQGFIRNRK